MDLKIAACVTPSPAPAVGERPDTAQVANGCSKMQDTRVLPAIHGEWQGQVFHPQDRYQALSTQDAVLALVRLLRDENVWANATLNLAQKA